MNALLLIDIQNDFLPGGALAVGEGDRVVPVANRLAARFAQRGELVVATQDWHPSDHASFAANHPGKKPGDRIMLAGAVQILWPVHCVQNTRGADFAPGLDRTPIAHITHKGTDPLIDSYSGFFDNAHGRSTDLDAFLKSRNIKDLYIAGLATDYCAKFTALDGLNLGYRVHLVLDGCRGVNLRPGDVDNAVAGLRNVGVQIVSSEDLP